MKGPVPTGYRLSDSIYRNGGHRGGCPGSGSGCGCGWHEGLLRAVGVPDEQCQDPGHDVVTGGNSVTGTRELPCTVSYNCM